jgi:hypothetical protein
MLVFLCIYTFCLRSRIIKGVRTHTLTASNFNNVEQKIKASLALGLR